MGDLARIDANVLPAEPQYRPLSNLAGFARAIAATVGVFVGTALLSGWLSVLMLLDRAVSLFESAGHPP